MAFIHLRLAGIVKTYGRHVPWLRRIWQPVVLCALSVLLARRYLIVHATHPIFGTDRPANAWFGWADQGAYYLAAQAWAAGNLSESQHHYPAGYSLLAAPFVFVTPSEPFYIPDLLCWIGALWLFADMAVSLAPRQAGMRALGGVLFTLVTVGNTKLFYTWETPWTSTPTCVCVFGALAMALRFSNGASLLTGSLASLLAGLIILFRPTDFGVVAGCLGLFLSLMIWQRRKSAPHNLTRSYLIVGCSFLIGPTLFGLTHLATHGLHLGPYLESSARIGFEWRLFPLRWVTLMLSPRPLYPAGRGLGDNFWWILPGMAGVIAACLADTGRRLQHALVGGGAIIFTCVYLCYRDLHATGLFGFMNQHYFKWAIPVFALYAVGLVGLLLTRRWAACLVGLSIMTLASFWRAELVRDPRQLAEISTDGRGLVLPHGLAPIDVAYLLRSPDDFVGLYLGQHTMVTEHALFEANSAFKVTPVPFGMMITPLRKLPTEEAVLHLKTTIHISPTEAVLRFSQRLVFGLPCMLAPRRSVCRYPDFLEPR